MSLGEVLNFWLPVSSSENEDHTLPQRVVARNTGFTICTGPQTTPFKEHAVRGATIDSRPNKVGPAFSSQNTGTWGTRARKALS